MQVQQNSRGRWLLVFSLLAAGVVVSAGLLRGAGPATAESAKPANAGLTDAAKTKVDPVQANGAIFEGWPKPDLALVFTAELDGYLEPCGCAGLENQKGGLKRRYTFLQELRKKGWPLV